MKIFRSASLFIAMFLLCGVNIEASTPKVTVSESGEVQVSNVGNNIIGLELTLELGDGSFQNTAFTPLANTSYTFEKVSGNKITIYSTGSDDLSNNGTVILGSINTTANATFTSGATVNFVDQSLAQNVYANVAVVNQMKTVTTSGTTSQGSSGSSNTTNSTGDATSESEELTSEEVEEDAQNLEQGNEDLSVYQNDSTTHNGDTETYVEEKESNYNWLFLLLLIIVGGGVIFYINKPQAKYSTNAKEAMVKPNTVVPNRKQSNLKIDRRVRDIDTILAEKAEESKDAQYQEW